ncbi:phage/plasmid primase, P4 family [Kytococcus schroeteri]|uniref:DNA primase family protein n=1 Tax=Kytococcus schroeteri TaxID=138300 RepID=UPI001EE1ED79|nr:phage/plasmid primase, P4 family [Kytococcus schroeteri]
MSKPEETHHGPVPDPWGGPQLGAHDDRSRGQVRMAYRLADAYADRLLHVHGIGWLHWDGKRWAEDVTGAATRAVLDVLDTAWSEARKDAALEADVRKCETAAGVRGVLDLAAALETFAATVDDLDADPALLNCANGTLDLDTGELKAHDPRDRLTKVCRAAYDPDAQAGEWGRFLARVLPDDAEREYLQRVVGQALYGRVREHLFPVLIGEGANGKSTAYDALNHALGDYAAVIDPSLLMASDKGHRNAGPELMELMGARLVVGSETEEGRKLDEPTMKRLTGGDALTARRLYREPVTWKPSHQLVYVTNHLPTVKGNDPAVWRRLRVVPFGVVVPPEERDPELPSRLEVAAEEVLAWAVAGWHDYRQGGMREPDSVVRATDDYRNDSDAVGRFVAERCYAAPGATATTRELYTAWQPWAHSEGAEPLSEKAFGAELDRLGFDAKRTKRGMTRNGIGLYAEDDLAGGEGW